MKPELIDKGRSRLIALAAGLLFLALAGTVAAQSSDTTDPSQNIPGIYGVVVKATSNTLDSTTAVPIPGAKVVLHNISSDWPTFAVIQDRVALTNELGQFGFPQVIPGVYELIVTKEGFQEAHVQVEYHANAGTVLPVLRVTIALIPNTQPPQGRLIYGKVFMRSSSSTSGVVPVPGALVEARPEIELPIYPPAPPIVSAVTGQNGMYEMKLPETAALPVMIWVTPPGAAARIFVKKIEQIPATGLLLNIEIPNTTEPTVTPTRTPELTQSPTPTRTPSPVEMVIYGTVYLGIPSATGGVAQPIPDALVEVRAECEIAIYPPPDPIASARTDAQGNYRIVIRENVPFPLIAKASKAGFLDSESKKIESIPTGGMRVNFALFPGGLITPTPTPIPEKGFAYGTVYAADRPSTDPTERPTIIKPLPGAKVVLWAQNDATGSVISTKPLGQAITDENGQYKIEDLPLGIPVLAQATKEGFTLDQKRLDTILPEGSPIDFFVYPRVWPTLTPVPTPPEQSGICGIVVEKTMLTVIIPIPGALVEIYNAGTGTVPPGMVTGSQNGASATEGSDDATIGDVPQPPVARVKTADDGSFCAAPLPAGPYWVRACAENHYSEFRHVEVVEGPPVYVVMALQAKPTPEPTPTPSSEKGTLFGKATTFAVSSTGAYVEIPLAGVEILAYADTPIMAAADNTGNSPLPQPPAGGAVTNNEGRYVIPYLTAGPYTVKAAKPGYETATKSAMITAGGRTELNFEMKPAPGPTPEPTVTPNPEAGALYGMVYDESAQTFAPGLVPVAGAEVLVFPAEAYINGTEARPLPLLGRGKSNGQGLYRIEPLPPIPVVVRVIHPDYLPAEAKADIQPSTDTLYNIGLKPLPPQPTPTPTATAVEPALFAGRVVAAGADGALRPIEGAKVCLFGNNSLSTTLQEPAGCTETNESGEFAMRVQPGPYVAVVEALGFLRQVRPVKLNSGLNEPAIFEMIPIPQPTPTPEPRLGNLKGVVMDVPPPNADVMPRPIADALVCLYKANSASDTLGEPVAKARTGKDGTFAIEPVPAGLYVGVAEKEGYMRDVKAVKIIAGETAEVRFNLAAREPEPTPTPLPERGALAGLVIEKIAAEPGDAPTTKPIAGAIVTAVLVDRTDPAADATKVAGRAVTDSQGRWAIEKLLPGEYIVVARAIGYEEGKASAVVNPKAVTRVVIVLEKKTPPDPTLPGVIEGRVMRPAQVDATVENPASSNVALEPVEGSTVTTYLILVGQNDPATMEPSGRAVTDAEGKYRIPGLAAGMHLVIAQAAGLQTRMQLAAVLPDLATRVDFILPPVRPEDGVEPPINIVDDEEGQNVADDDSAQWRLYGDPNQYDMPQGEHRNGWLVLRAVNNNHCFGAWQSVDGWLARKEDVLYRIKFVMATDETDPALAPWFRMRLNNDIYQQVDAFQVINKGDGSLAPTPDGTPYIWLVEAMKIGKVHATPGDGLHFSFDLINVAGASADQPELVMKALKIDTIPLASLQVVKVLKRWTFENGAEGWFAGSLPGQYEAPDFSAAGGALRTHSHSQNRIVGAWISPLDAIVCPEAGAIVRATFRVTGNQDDLSKITQLRVRINSLDNQVSIEKFIMSQYDGANSPPRSGKEYRLYLEVPNELAGKGIYFAIDHLCFDTSDAADNEIGLDSVVIEQLATP